MTKRSNPEVAALMTMGRVQSAQRIGINQRTLRSRLKRGWDPFIAATKPVARKTFSQQTKAKRAKERRRGWWQRGMSAERYRTGWKIKPR